MKVGPDTSENPLRNVIYLAQVQGWLMGMIVADMSVSSHDSPTCKDTRLAHMPTSVPHSEWDAI